MSPFIFPRLAPPAPIFLAIQLADLVVSLPPFALNPFNCPYFFFLYQHVNALIQYGGKDVRSSDLFGQNKTPLSLTRRFFKGLKVHRNNSYSLLMEL